MESTADPRKRHATALIAAGILLLLYAGIRYHLTHQHWVETQRQAGADALFGLDYGQASTPPSTLVPVLLGIAGAVLFTIGTAIVLVLPSGVSGLVSGRLEPDGDGRPPARRHAMHIHRGR